MRKKTQITLGFVSLLFFSIVVPSQSFAELIYFKDGKTLSCTILYRYRNDIWVRHPAGSLSFSRDGIDKIINDKGFISDYDYESLWSSVPEMVQQKRYKDAITICNKLLVPLPDNVPIRYLRGIMYQKVDDFAKAVVDYDYLIEHHYGDATILNNRGSIYAKNKDFDKAREMFDRALAESPRMPEVHMNLGEMFLGMNNYPGAIGEYQKVLAEDFHNTDALYNLGVAYYKNKQPALAKANWEKVLTVEPGNNEARIALEGISASGKNN